jgi:hypothetical protein
MDRLRSHANIAREKLTKRLFFYRFVLDIGSEWFLFSPRIPLEYQQNYGNCNEDDDEPFSGTHGETAHSPQTHHKKHQGKDKENYCKLD